MDYSVHHVPGRIRYKIPGLTHDEMRVVGRLLERCRDAEHVEVRPASSSLIIHYDPAFANVRHLHACIASGLKSIPSSVPAGLPPQKGTGGRFRNEAVVRSVHHLGVVFGKTAFKVALEQAVRGGLSSLNKTVLERG